MKPANYQEYEMAVDPPGLFARRTAMFTLAIFVVALVALYPYLESAGMCDSGECPQIANSISGGSSGVCCPALSALAATSAVAPAALDLRLRGPITVQSPYQTHFSPESPSPRLSV